MIGISRLFHEQQLLDKMIADKLGKTVKDFLPERTLALVVEIAEAANECRCFKFWSEQRGVRRGTDNEMLYELADILHFTLGTANSFGLTVEDLKESFDEERLERRWDKLFAHGLTVAFNELLLDASNLLRESAPRAFWPMPMLNKNVFAWILEDLFVITHMLGFSMMELEAAYYEKLEINYQRQKEGY